MRTTCSNKLLWILHFFVKSSKNWYVVPHKNHWYTRKDFLKKYSKTRKLEHFEDKRTQKSAKNQFFAKHQSKKWYFWKRISQGGPIYLGTFRVWQAKNSMKYEPSYHRIWLIFFVIRLFGRPQNIFVTFPDFLFETRFFPDLWLYLTKLVIKM